MVQPLKNFLLFRETEFKLTLTVQSTLRPDPQAAKSYPLTRRSNWTNSIVDVAWRPANPASWTNSIADLG